VNASSKVFIAGHNGMVGSAIWRNLQAKGYANLIGKSSKELDSRNEQAVADFFEQEKPEYAFLTAAKVGGIMANDTYRAEFIYNNIQVQNNIIHQSYISGVKKLLFNVSKAQVARSSKDFFAKMFIAFNEARETDYWLQLLEKNKYLFK
jgi:GDP-L-fucose synthase